MAIFRKKRDIVPPELFNDISQPLLILDKKGEITEVNRATEKFLGTSAPKLLGTGFPDIFEDGTVPLINETWAKWMELGKGEIRGTIAINGQPTEIVAKIKWIGPSAAVIIEPYTGASPDRLCSYYNNLLENAREALMITHSGRVSEVNEVFCSMIGYSREELIGENPIDLVSAESRSTAAEIIRIILEGGIVDDDLIMESKTGVKIRTRVRAHEIQLQRSLGAIYAIQKISEKTSIDERISDSVAKFQAIVENSPNIIAFLSYQGENLYLNTAWSKILGYPLEEGLGKNGIDYVYPDDREMCLAELQNIINARKYIPEIIFRLVNSDNDTIWVNASGGPVLDDRGRVICAFIICRDITENILANQKNELFTKSLDNISEGVFIIDQSKTIVYANESLCKKWGYPSIDLLGSDPWKLIKPIEDTEKKLIMDMSMSIGWRGRLDAVRSDGTEFPIELSMTSVDVSNVTGDIFIGVVHDISKQEEMLSSIRDSETLYRVLFEHLTEAIFLADQNWRVQNANSRAQELFGVDVQRLLGKSIGMFMVRHSRQDLIKITGRMTVDQSYSFLSTCRRADNTEFAGEVDVRRITMENENRLVVCIRDITEQQRLINDLIESERRFRLAADNLPLGFALYSPDLTILEWNKSAEEIMNMSRDDVVGKNMLELMPHIKEKGLYDAFSDVMKTGISRDLADITYEHDTLKSYIDIRAFKVGEGFATIFSDITLQKQLSEQLRQSQKMETIGTLAGSIAHDFNNILAGILGSATNTLQLQELDENSRRDIENIERAAHRGADLTSQLLTFSRRGGSIKVPLDMLGVIDEAISLVGSTLGPRYTINLNKPDEPLVIEADATQIEQVLMNLCVNARDSMISGGMIDILIRRIVKSEKDAADNYEARSGDFAEITITDEGGGVDPSILPRIFDPFFTSKEQGKGTGLGLAVVYGIVKDHGGWIEVDNRPGAGVSFIICLPISKKKPHREDILAERAIGGTETILLVDDEEIVREMGESVLSRLGYVVLQANDGEQALTIYRERFKNIDLIILDLSMPVMGGHECFREIKKVNHKAKVIVASGYAQDDLTSELMEAGVNMFLQKPFTARELAGAVRVVIEGKKVT